MVTKPSSGTVLITGGTANLGFHAALDIARSHPEYTVVITSRSDGNDAAGRINKVLHQSNVIFLPIDLFSTPSIRAFAANWPSHNFPPIKALLLNAALQFPNELQMSAEGIEKTFAMQVGSALLFHLLVPYLDAAGARIIVTSSGTHDPAQKSGLPDAVYNTAEDLAHPPPDMVDIDGKQRYSTTKLTNVLWTYALHRRLVAGGLKITANAFDPGLMPGTGLAREYNAVGRWIWNHILPRVLPLLRLVMFENIHTPAESGAALARLAVGKDVEGVSGKYFEGMKEIKSSVVSYDEEKQEDLWRWTVGYLSRDEGERKKWEEFK